MKVCRTVKNIRREVQILKSGNRKIGFVPTMGALHEGHIALIRQARSAADAVVVSIFVNPEQFGPNEDFDSYPRTLKQDLEVCKREGVDLVFTPDREEMYSGTAFLKIRIDQLNRHMCGGSRPGFFEGIVLVVNKFFNIIKPDAAVFGQKDIQQFQILKQMVREFNHNIELVMAPIVRASDGLALSSRNAYLNDVQRKKAPALYRSLQSIEREIEKAGRSLAPGDLIRKEGRRLEAKGLKIDYLDVFSLQTLQPEKMLEKGGRYILAGAVWLGKTRLIDNILIE